MKRCLKDRGARHGATLGDVGYAIEQVAEREGYGIVKSLVGHGIGRAIHEPPDVPNYGIPGRGLKLKEGMVITIEPVLLWPLGCRVLGMTAGPFPVRTDRWASSMSIRLLLRVEKLLS